MRRLAFLAALLLALPAAAQTAPGGPTWKVAGTTAKNVKAVNFASGGTFSSGTLTVTAGGGTPASVVGAPNASVEGGGAAAVAATTTVNWPSGTFGAAGFVDGDTITIPSLAGGDFVITIGNGGGQVPTTALGSYVATNLVGSLNGVTAAQASATSSLITQNTAGAFTGTPSRTGSGSMTFTAFAGGSNSTGAVNICTASGTVTGCTIGKTNLPVALVGTVTINGLPASANGQPDATATSIGTNPVVIKTYILAFSEALACDGWVYSTAKFGVGTYSAGFNIHGLWSRGNSGQTYLDDDAAGWVTNTYSVAVTPVSPSWSGAAYSGTETVALTPTATGLDIKGNGAAGRNYRWALSPGACVVISTANF